MELCPHHIDNSHTGSAKQSYNIDWDACSLPWVSNDLIFTAYCYEKRQVFCIEPIFTEISLNIYIYALCFIILYSGILKIAWKVV